MSTPRTHPQAAESALPQLSWWSFGFALAVTLAIFFGLHPLWKPMTMDAMDRNIAWSYAPIPLLVLALLALERKLRWSTFLLETVRLTLVKFAITFLFANVLWSIVGPPGHAEPPAESLPAGEQPGRFEVREPPPATPLDQARTGRLAGLVVDASGAPLAGALVAVTGGLEGLVFAPRPGGVVLSHDGTGLQPTRAVVQVFERLVLRGTPSDFHTVSATEAGGRPLFNVPLLPGTERTLMFHRPQGRVFLACSVHGHNDRVAELAVVAHPFAQWTGADGRFSFEGVPAGELQLTAWGAGPGEARVQVSLPPRGDVGDLRLALP